MTRRPHLPVLVILAAIVAAVILADTGARHKTDTPDPVRSPDVVLVTVTAAPTVTPTVTATATRTVTRAARSGQRTKTPRPVVVEGKPRTGRGPTAEQWRVLEACESSGNPRAVSSSGRYTGLHQFDVGTWASVGGTEYAPTAGQATATQQREVALRLWQSRGWQPWPVCGLRAAAS